LHGPGKAGKPEFNAIGARPGGTAPRVGTTPPADGRDEGAVPRAGGISAGGRTPSTTSGTVGPAAGRSGRPAAGGPASPVAPSTGPATALRGPRACQAFPAARPDGVRPVGGSRDTGGRPDTGNDRLGAVCASCTAHGATTAA